MVKTNPYDTLIETSKETPIGVAGYPAFKELRARRWKKCQGKFLCII